MRSNRVSAIEARGASNTAARTKISTNQTNGGTISLWTRLEESWNSIQVARQGSYSIERVESLDHYCKTTSRTRVILVCVLTPVPSLALAVLLEFLPLRPPSEGCNANWVFWIRLSLMKFVLIYAGVSQLIIFVPGLNATVAKRFIVALAASSCSLGTDFFAATMIGFPVPFVAQLGCITLSICIPVLIRIVLGRKPFAKSSHCRLHLQQFYRFLRAYSALVGVYPLYKVFYDFVPVIYLGSAVIVLAIWKFAAKHFIIRASRGLEDFMPELVAFSVDFLSALFVSVCISTSGSLYLTAAFIAVDFGLSVLEFKEVSTKAQVVVNLLHDRRNSMEYLRDESWVRNVNTDLLSMMLATTRDPSASSITSLESARLWACVPHSMTEEQAKILQQLDLSGVYGSRGLTSRRTWLSRRKMYRSLLIAQLVPITSTSSPAPEATSAGQGDAAKISEQFILQSLQLLFHCEYLTLVEYVECIVPLVFVIYKSILEQLPNVNYFPGGAGNWKMGAIANVLISAVLEIGSLILLSLFLQRKFSFSPLYQLAFVLETQIITVQGKICLAMVSLLQCQLAHLGADFTLRFKWLHDNNQ